MVLKFPLRLRQMGVYLSCIRLRVLSTCRPRLGWRAEPGKDTPLARDDQISGRGICWTDHLVGWVMFVSFPAAVRLGALFPAWSDGLGVHFRSVANKAQLGLPFQHPDPKLPTFTVHGIYFNTPAPLARSAGTNRRLVD